MAEATLSLLIHTRTRTAIYKYACMYPALPDSGVILTISHFHSANAGLNSLLINLASPDLKRPGVLDKSKNRSEDDVYQAKYDSGLTGKGK